MAEWIERDAIPDLEVGNSGADLDDFACGFVAENHGESRDHSLSAEFPIDDMQIGAAYAAGADANQQRGFGGRRHGRVDQFGAGRRASLCDRFNFRTL